MNRFVAQQRRLITAVQHHKARKKFVSRRISFHHWIKVSRQAQKARRREVETLFHRTIFSFRVSYRKVLRIQQIAFKFRYITLGRRVFRRLCTRMSNKGIANRALVTWRDRFRQKRLEIIRIAAGLPAVTTLRLSFEHWRKQGPNLEWKKSQVVSAKANSLRQWRARLQARQSSRLICNQHLQRVFFERWRMNCDDNRLRESLILKKHFTIWKLDTPKNDCSMFHNKSIMTIALHTWRHCYRLSRLRTNWKPSASVK
jgi:hypothetical protein